MYWFVNDASLQGQFHDRAIFETMLLDIINIRGKFPRFSKNFRTTRLLRTRPVAQELSLHSVVAQSQNRDFRRAVLLWLDKTGPFIDEDRYTELEDYFECLELDVTDGGLGEAARRLRAGQEARTFSFAGGDVEFGRDPLVVEHGLSEERFGSISVENTWLVQELERLASIEVGEITSWRLLVEEARHRFPMLCIPDSVYQNHLLAREPFDAIIRERSLFLFYLLNRFMESRVSGGPELIGGREIVAEFFAGERALFTAESTTNQREFSRILTFADPEDDRCTIFAHWHGKISHRVFRLHFEWPVPVTAAKLKILYLGPKLTKK